MNDASQLLEVLISERRLLSTLATILDQERDILVAGHADALELLSQEKLNTLAEIERSAKTRLNLCAAMGLPTAPQALSQWFSELASKANPSLADAWTQLLSATREVKALHERNQHLLTLLIAKTNEALAILQQHQRHQSLYGKDGQSAPASGNRISDSA